MPPVLISDAASLKACCLDLQNQPVIGVDTEFIRERTFFPNIALIQVASLEKTWLIDPLAFDGAGIEPLLEIFRRKDILKIMHAAYADQECLFWEYKMVAEPILDTAVGAALLGIGDNVGLGNLVKELLRITLPKGLARAKWLDRPLPRELVEYASLDVAHLVRLGGVLKERLDEKKRFDWALEESEIDTKVFDESPDDIARKVARSGSLDVKSSSILFELVVWREKRARDANLPRNWVSDNETLKNIAKVKPQTVEALSQFRGLNRREVQVEGKTILAAIERGKNSPARQWTSSHRLPPLSGTEECAVDLIRAYVNLLADKHSIAPRFLLSGDKLPILLQLGPSVAGEWVAKGVLSSRAYDLIGPELSDFLRGRRALALSDRSISILELDR